MTTDDTEPLIDLLTWKRLTGATWTWLAERLPCSKPYPGMLATGRAHPSYDMAVRIEEVTGGMVSRHNWYPIATLEIGEPNTDIIDEVLK